MMKCFENVIGVTTSDCSCIVEGLDAATRDKLKISKSGLYLDNLPGGVQLKSLQYIDACKDMAALTFGAIENAGTQLSKDIVLAMADTYSKSLKAFVGTIGQLSYSGTLPVSKKYQYFLLSATPGADAILTINRLFVILNASENLTLKIIKTPQNGALGVEIKSINFTSSANNQVQLLTEPLVLPLTENGRPLDYYFVYDTTPGAGVQPKNNKIQCSCPDSQKQTLAAYVRGIGGQMDNINNLNDKTADGYTHGIVLDADVRCNTEQFVCREYDNAEATAVALAYCLWYKAGELLIEGIMNTNEINRYTTLNREYLWGKRNHFAKQYAERLPFLAQTIDVTSSNCYVCKDEAILQGNILATRGDYFKAQNTLINASNEQIYGANNTPGYIDEMPDGYFE
jgi:hypothetical protein